MDFGIMSFADKLDINIKSAVAVFVLN